MVNWILQWRLERDLGLWRTWRKWDEVGCVVFLVGSQAGTKKWPQWDCEPTSFHGRMRDHLCMGFCLGCALGRGEGRELCKGNDLCKFKKKLKSQTLKMAFTVPGGKAWSTFIHHLCPGSHAALQPHLPAAHTIAPSLPGALLFKAKIPCG